MMLSCPWSLAIDNAVTPYSVAELISAFASIACRTPSRSPLCAALRNCSAGVVSTEGVAPLD